MAYEVKLDVFEGPIDLLLHLITRQRVDIYDVSLATITDEYLHALADVPALDLDGATGFLVVAATLLELKTARLLPSGNGADSERLLEDRDLLLARLVECATFRAAGAWIGDELALGEAWHARSAVLEPRFVDLAPDPLAHTDVADLTRTASRALEPKSRPEVDTSHVAPIRASVRDALVEVSAVLRERGHVTLRELCRGVGERIQAVVRFLALLELFKAGAVEISQSEAFGDIEARWIGDAGYEQLMADADEYVVEQRGGES